MAKYGKKAQSEVKKAVRKKKKGQLHSGKTKKKVKSKKQAIAIGLSKAQEGSQGSTQERPQEEQQIAALLCPPR